MILIQNPQGTETCYINADDLPLYEGWMTLGEGEAARPVLDGVWNGSDWEVPVGVLKARAKAKVEASAELAFAAGFTSAVGPLQGHTLQCRDSVDRTNWLTSQNSYMAAVQAGMGDVQGAAFRTLANETITLTFAEGLDVLTNGMALWGKAIMERSWALKDAVAAATTAEELEAIEIETGWP